MDTKLAAPWTHDERRTTRPNLDLSATGEVKFAHVKDRLRAGHDCR